MSDLYAGINKTETQLPTNHLVLMPPYPNPFNYSTKVSIRSDIMVDRAEVYVVNLAGQRVAQLFSGSFSIGVHTFDWNGSDVAGREVASGVYFVIVSTDNEAHKQKLLLVK